MEDLYNSPSMTGLISFLERPPTSGEDITDLPAFRHLKKDHFPALDVNGNHESNLPPSSSTVLRDDMLPTVSTVPVDDHIEQRPVTPPIKSTVPIIDTVLVEGAAAAHGQEPAIASIQGTVLTESTVPAEGIPLTRSTVVTES